MADVAKTTRRCLKKGHRWRHKVWGMVGTDVCTRRGCDAERVNPMFEEAPPWAERCTRCVHVAHPGRPCGNMAYLDPCGCLGEETA